MLLWPYVPKATERIDAKLHFSLQCKNIVTWIGDEKKENHEQWNSSTISSFGSIPNLRTPSLMVAHGIRLVVKPLPT